MTATTTPAVPSQLALSNLTETLAALFSEAEALFGERGYLADISMGVINPETWHALPEKAEYPAQEPRNTSWKHIAQNGRAFISAHCGHGAECPDIPHEAEDLDRVRKERW